MAGGKRIKNRIIIDVVVILVIILATIGYSFFSTKNLPGWDIKDKEERLEGGEKEVESNVYVREGGVLIMDDSTLIFSASNDNQYGLFINGDSRLEMKNSEIKADGSRYFISADDSEGKSPEIKMENAEIEGSTNLYLRNRSRLNADESEIGRLRVQDNARADLENTIVELSFLSKGSGKYEALIPGENISREIESDSGWEVKMKNCTVTDYRIVLMDGDDVSIDKSEGISLELHSPGDLEKEVSLDLSFVGRKSSSTLDQFGFSLEWMDTLIDAVGIQISGNDEIKVQGGVLDELGSDETSSMEVLDSVLICNFCMFDRDSTAIFDRVTVQVEDKHVPSMTIRGLSVVTIRNSDIRGMEILIDDSATLKLVQTEYDEDLIETSGEGAFEVE